MTDRSSRAIVRNPLLAHPATAKLKALPDPARLAIRDLAREIAADARIRADKAWRTHKAPMAVYWKAVAVYAGHLARALNVAAQPWCPDSEQHRDGVACPECAR